MTGPGPWNLWAASLARWQAGWFSPIGLIGLGAAVAAPWVLDTYTIAVAGYAVVLAVLAGSTHLLTSVARLPTVGQGAYLGIGAYAAAACARGVTTSGPVQMVVAAAAAAMVAAGVGAAVTRTRGASFLLASLAIAELVQVVARQATGVTGGDAGLATPPVVPLPGLPPLTLDGYRYLYVLACATVLLGGTAIVVRTRPGLVLRAIADHEQRAAAAGHPVGTYLWLTYVAAAALAGAGGALLVAVHRYVAPADLSFTVSALALLATVLLGTSLTGAVLGAVSIIAVRDLVAGQVLGGGHGPALLGALFLAAAYARVVVRTRRPRREAP